MAVPLALAARVRCAAHARTWATEPGAPVKAHLWQKVLATTVISAVVTVLLFWALSNPALQEYWS